MKLWHLSMTAVVGFYFLIFSSSFAFSAQKKSDVSEPKIIVFELEFIPKAELYKTANFLRTQGLNATVITDPRELIVIESESYNNALEKLKDLVPSLPDIARFIWKNGNIETILYQAREADLFVEDREITDNRKILPEWDDNARMTLVLKEDKQSIIKYQSTVKKIERMGYKVTFAEGYMDAGWLQFPAIDIEIPNNIVAFKNAILELSELSEINRFLYKRGKNPHSNEYTITFLPDTDLELQISRILANGIEIYKVDKLLNRIFIHFPNVEARNNIKLDQIKLFDDLIIVKNLHENHQWIKPEFEKNLKHVWLDIPEEVLKGQWKYNDYSKALVDLARDEVVRLKSKGMVVVNYGVYTESGEILIPEILFTHRDVDTPKAKELMKSYNTKATISIKPKASSVVINSCNKLFSN